MKTITKKCDLYDYSLTAAARNELRQGNRFVCVCVHCRAQAKHIKDIIHTPNCCFSLSATDDLAQQFNAATAPNLHSDLITIEGKLETCLNSHLYLGAYTRRELEDALSLIRKHITLIEKENTFGDKTSPTATE